MNPFSPSLLGSMLQPPVLPPPRLSSAGNTKTPPLLGYARRRRRRRRRLVSLACFSPSQLETRLPIHLLPIQNSSSDRSSLVHLAPGPHASSTQRKSASAHVPDDRLPIFSSLTSVTLVGRRKNRTSLPLVRVVCGWFITSTACLQHQTLSSRCFYCAHCSLGP